MVLFAAKRAKVSAPEDDHTREPACCGQWPIGIIG